MEVDFALLTDGVSQRPDGKFDLFGAGFDTIFAPATPARHASLTLAIRILLTRQEAQNPHRIQVFLLHADGAEIARVEGQMTALPAEVVDTLPAGRRIAIVPLLQFNGLVFPTFGPYHIAIHWDGNEARSPIPLFVERTGPPPDAEDGGDELAADEPPAPLE